MECDNILKLQEIKAILILQALEVNSLIKYGDRNILTLDIIKTLQSIRGRIEDDIKTCNSLLNNSNIAFIDISSFLYMTNCYIENTRDYINIINKINK